MINLFRLQLSHRHRHFAIATIATVDIGTCKINNSNNSMLPMDDTFSDKLNNYYHQRCTGQGQLKQLTVEDIFL